MTGHDCDECGATIVQCDEHIKDYGQGCCGSCFTRDTHGLLDKFKVIDVADHAQEIDNLTRLMAQTVIARGEHAQAIYQLRAEVNRLSEAVARIEGRLDREEVGEKKHLMQEMMIEVRDAVHDLPERLKELEDVAVGLEHHLRIVRRPKEKRAQ